MTICYFGVRELTANTYFCQKLSYLRVPLQFVADEKGKKEIHKR